jgi:small basic protein
MRKYLALLAGIVTIGVISEFGVDEHHNDYASAAMMDQAASPSPIVTEL